MQVYRGPAVLVLALFAGVGVAREPEVAPGDRILARFVDEFILVRPGSPGKPARFTLGSAEREAPASEKPTVEVTLTQPFRMARYEVTQELYATVMGNNPARWKGPRNSVEMVDWNDANTFCRKVTGMLRARKLLGADEEIRLPSEAEWEYACRAATSTRFSFGDKADELGAYAWYKANSKGEDPPVGRKKPNAWGLYDMHGYVWEWCADTWSPTHEGAAKDGAARTEAGVKERVIRGGSFADPAEQCSSTARAGKAVSFRSDQVGFRCVRAQVPGKTAEKEKER
jgi:formylglycine-generating enzyme required for sulfatase activity